MGIELFHADRQTDRWADMIVMSLSVVFNICYAKAPKKKSTEHDIVKDAICTVWRALINVRVSVVNLAAGKMSYRHPSLWLNITYHTTCIGF